MLNIDLKRWMKNPFIKDSFWAVFGNGIGNFLLLMAGIIIARFLGKDVYGEYGMVKTTMFHIAAFASFGLSYTSTKFIAEYKIKDDSCIKSISISAINTTFISSSLFCIIMFVLSGYLAEFIHAKQLESAFKFLSVIMIFRALSTVGAGLLSGFKKFKNLGINNIISGVIMLVLSMPLTYYYGLKGSLVTLCISQFVLALLNILNVLYIVLRLENQRTTKFYRELFSFSVPIELQELSYVISQWGANLIITRYASLGELGIYTACAQWYAIVLFLPSLLQNVILSYLSSSINDQKTNKNMLHLMLRVNFICAIIPFSIAAIASPLIVSFYGITFIGMESTLVILMVATIPTTLANVYVANLLANSRAWLLSVIRISRDAMSIILLYFVLLYTNGENASYNYAVINTLVAVVFFVNLLLSTKKYQDAL